MSDNVKMIYPVTIEHSGIRLTCYLDRMPEQEYVILQNSAEVMQMRWKVICIGEPRQAKGLQEP